MLTRVRPRLTGVLGAVLLAVAVTGCGSGGSGSDGPDGTSGDPGSSDMTIEETRTLLREQVQAVAGVLADDGWEVGDASGRYQSCSGDPSPTVGYSTTMTVQSRGGDLAGSIQQVAELFEGRGWTLDSSGTEPRAYANLARDDLTLAVGESRSDVGAMFVGVGAPCVDGDLSDVDGDLAPEPIDLG